MKEERKIVLEGMSSEFEGAELGDARLAKRLVSIADAAVAAPSASLPEQAGNDAALEATYRFLNNDSVQAATILAPHYRQTVRRCRDAGAVLCLHDTSIMEFGGEAVRSGLGPTHNKHRGFFAHVTLCVSRTENIPTGVVAMRSWPSSARM